MTNNPETLAPMNLMEATAAAYLYDLARAAKMAELHLADSRVRLDMHRHLRNIGGERMDLNQPTSVVWGDHNQALTLLKQAAVETYRSTVAWYARSATLALEAVLAGTKVTAQELEARTLRRPRGSEDLWPAPNRPPIPPVGDLMTGHEDIDKPVVDASLPLLAAYQAADQIDGMASSDFDIRTEWEAAEYHTAEERARPLWELLLAWAAAVDFAAQYGRSRARGHKPAEQSGEAIDR